MSGQQYIKELKSHPHLQNKQATMTDKELAEDIGCSAPTVYRYRKRFKIKCAPRKYHPPQERKPNAINELMRGVWV